MNPSKSKFKILVLGDSNTGKTSLIKSMLCKPFNSKIEPT
jgi:GTPase SAR1 family protein